MDPNAIDPELLARLQADQEWMALYRELEAARQDVEDIERPLVAARELVKKPTPPQTRPIPGTWGLDPRRETNPDYTKYQDAKRLVAKYDNPLLDDSALKALEALRKKESDLELKLGDKASAIQTAKNTPLIRDVNGQTAIIDPATGEARPVTLPTPPPISAGEGVDDRLVGQPKGTTIRREIENHPKTGVAYYVEYFYGPDGKKGGVASDEAHRPIEVGGGLGAAAPGAGVELATAQTNLEIARARLAEATSPEARAKAHLEVQQAQLALQTAQLGLEQTRERSPIDLATAQTNLALAQQRLAEATSPEAQEQRRIELEQARFELEQAQTNAPLERETAQIGLERGRLGLETERLQQERLRTLQDPVAEYQRQVQLTQQQATAYRDQLNDKVLRGEVTVEDASREFDRWWDGNVEARLTPYQTMAEGAYRKEQNDYLQAQAQEQARVEAINRQRETLGYQAGEKARDDLNALAPQARSPEFLAQLAQNVSRIGQPLPGGPSQHHGGMQFSPESLSLENVRRNMPNLTEVGNQAVARALSRISPAAAQQVGVAPPKPPGLPDFQAFAAQAPFQIPDPTQVLPGMGAVDLGGGMARTTYQGGRTEDWRIPA